MGLIVQSFYSSGNWTTVDNSNHGYTNWGVDEPRGNPRDPLCAVFDVDSGVWISQHCKERAGYVCRTPKMSQ